MELNSISERLATLLELIAQDSEFDEQKYVECENLLATVSKDKLLGTVADELTEYYGYWHQRTLWGKPSKPSEENGELEGLRANLKLFAQAIRLNVRDFVSIKDLRRKLEQLRSP